MLGPVKMVAFFNFIIILFLTSEPAGKSGECMFTPRFQILMRITFRTSLLLLVVVAWHTEKLVLIQS